MAERHAVQRPAVPTVRCRRLCEQILQQILQILEQQRANYLWFNQNSLLSDIYRYATEAWLTLSWRMIEIAAVIVCASLCIYTVSQKKHPTCKLSVTLSNLNRFSKLLHYWKAYKIRYKTDTTLPTSP